MPIILIIILVKGLINGIFNSDIARRAVNNNIITNSFHPIILYLPILLITKPPKKKAGVCANQMPVDSQYFSLVQYIANKNNMLHPTTITKRTIESKTPHL